MDSTATRGRRRSGTVAYPIDDAAPVASGPHTVPALSTMSPSATSPPRRRTCWPSETTSRTSTSAGSGASPIGWSVSSTGTMASAPGGSGAPVMMRAHSPSPTSGADEAPAGMSPTTRSRTPGARSAARTANPSIAELSKGGTAKRARRSSANTWPTPSPMGTSSTGRTVASPTMRARYSSTLNTYVTFRSGSTDQRARAASNTMTRPTSGSPKPASSLMASVAWRAPTWPTIAPRTPTSTASG